jgi:hypothetical protein
MDHAHEIATLKQQLAETDRHVQSSADLREKIAAHEVAEPKAGEAARCAREAEEAAHVVEAAERDARAAEVGPLKAELEAIEQQLAAADAAAREQLHTAVEACRAIHAERERLVRQHDSIRGRLSGHGDWNQRANPLGFAALLRQHLAREVE